MVTDTSACRSTCEQVADRHHADQSLLGPPPVLPQPVRDIRPVRSFGIASSTVPARVSQSSGGNRYRS